MDNPAPKIAEFVAFVHQYVKGDEKGEAQIFCDRLFRGFGHPGIMEAGGTLEFRVHEGKGTRFADLLWRPRLLLEMKKGGEPLQRHYQQLRDYWWNLAPNRPQYAVLCNFNDFWIYDLNYQVDEPMDRVGLDELPQRYTALNFLFPEERKPQFNNDRVAVTRAAADKVAQVFNLLVKRKDNGKYKAIPRDKAQRFILQCVIALFAEDIDLLPRGLFTELLTECKGKASSYDLLGGLFSQMAKASPAEGGRFRDVPYFNGGLFSVVEPIELKVMELTLLQDAASENWSRVNPAIFGTLFESSMDERERHAFGAHFTSETDILKVVRPTIVEPWRERIAAADTARELLALCEQLARYRVLDSACGSGNFLYVAYRELKRIELELLDKLYTKFPSQVLKLPGSPSLVNPWQFYGIDIKPFAVELAKVTLMLAKKLAYDETQARRATGDLHYPADLTDHPLPLDNLDANFHATDALIDENGKPAMWPKADVIIGNPPFLGAKLLKPIRGVDYINAVRSAYPDVPGMADYCVYWFRKAHDCLQECTPECPLSGRAGLVGTQNIRNTQSRVGGLDHIVKTGSILEAVDNQPWSGEANVSVSIVNWVKSQARPLLLGKRRLWFKMPQGPSGQAARKRGSGPAAKRYELDCRQCDHINAALSDQTDVTGAQVLRCNTKPQRSFIGQMLGHDGFLLTEEQRQPILRAQDGSSQILYPYLNGREFLTGSGVPERYVLDFGQRDQLEAAAFPAAFRWVSQRVLPDRQRKAQEGMDKKGKMRPHHKAFLARWWQLSFGRPELISMIEKTSRFICCSRVTKRPVFVFVSPGIRPGDALACFCFEDDYSFGILQSGLHWLWFTTKCSKLTERFRYTPDAVFDTFPWPQEPTLAQIRNVADAAVALRALRRKVSAENHWSLRDLYRTLDLPGKNPLRDAHAALDAAVQEAYGMKPKADALAFLLALNAAVAGREAAKEPVTAPGLPPCVTDPQSFITTDCIQIPE